MTPAVYRAIALGNECRERTAWSAAAEHYGDALSRDPSLTHIWVQRGHMLKEAGDANGAADAYMAALRLQPGDQALLGWMYGIAGRLRPERRRELIGEIYLLQGRPIVQPVEQGRGAGGPRAGEVVFDVSDLMAYFARARRPTGIQRVQIEIIRAALRSGMHPIRICCSIEQSLCWVEVDAELFQRVVNLAVSGDRVDDDEWRDTIQDLNTALIFGSPFDFGEKGKLVNLGTSWWLQNYFLQVRNAKASQAFEYIPFVHDLIPVLAPQHCVEGLVQDFNSWIMGVFEHARRFLVNSEATKRDLLKVAALLERPLTDDAITVVPLDGVFEPPQSLGPPHILEAAGLAGRPFVLFVSTIESRKGHLVALRAWQRLLAVDPVHTPYLVFVGNKGWLNGEVYGLLEQDRVLQDRVVLLSGVSDSDLGELYRRCLFTIYPSTYEGWGLPITEALNLGKLVIAADNSSLPEAGGVHAVYTRTHDDAHLADEVARYASDPVLRAEREREIAASFRPRSWSAIAAQILEAVQSGDGTTEDPDAAGPGLPLGRWLDFRRQTDIGLSLAWPSAEPLRYGTGWHPPDERGNALASGEAQLRFRPPAGRTCLVVLLRLARTGTWRLSIGDETLDRGTSAGPGYVWAAGAIHGRAGPLTLTIEGAAEPESDRACDEPWLSLCGCVIAQGGEAALAAIKHGVESGRIDAIQGWNAPGCLATAVQKIGRFDDTENLSEN